MDNSYTRTKVVDGITYGCTFELTGDLKKDEEGKKAVDRAMSTI